MDKNLQNTVITTPSSYEIIETIPNVLFKIPKTPRKEGSHTFVCAGGKTVDMQETYRDGVKVENLYLNRIFYAIRQPELGTKTLCVVQIGIKTVPEKGRFTFLNIIRQKNGEKMDGYGDISNIKIRKATEGEKGGYEIIGTNHRIFFE